MAKWILHLLQITLVTYLVIALIIQINTGWADNGDFTRNMIWFTSGPVGFESNIPPKMSPAWESRFFNHYLPYWKLDFPLTTGTISSTLLLWLPGVLLNYLFYSTKVLALPLASIVPRLMFLVILLMCLFWLADRSLPRSQALILSLVIGLPLALMLSTADYVAFLNSFYQETASFIFLFLLLFSLIRLKRHRSRLNYLLSFFLVVLLAAAKPSNLYWPFLALLWIIPFPQKKNRWIVFSFMYIILAFTIAIPTAWLGRRGIYPRINEYHSLFLGILPLSQHPQRHLDQLGMPAAFRCIGKNAHSKKGANCYAKFYDRLSFLANIQILLNEPLIFPRMLKNSAAEIQDISLDLGKYAEGSNARAFFHLPVELNAWSRIKANYFPRGYPLLFLLFFWIGLFAWNSQQPGSRGEAAALGLLASCACIVDMAVAYFGDGRADITKHLFLANLLFDIAILAFIAWLVILVFEYRTEKLSGPVIIRTGGT
jgi:hypothetical protein